MSGPAVKPVANQQTIPFSDASSVWQNYSEFQQQQHMTLPPNQGIRSSMNNHYHQKNLSQQNQIDANGHFTISSEMPESKQNQNFYSKGKDQVSRHHYKGSQQGPNINLTVTNSKQTNMQNTQTKQKTKTSSKLTRVGTAVAGGSHSISRAQKVVNQSANRSLNKYKNEILNSPGKRQKENNNQTVGMEQSTYQTIKNLVSGKNQQAHTNNAQVQKVQPQLQLQKQSSSGQKQRPKSSNPTSTAIIKRRNILHVREDSQQMNLQSQYPGGLIPKYSGIHKNQLPGTVVSSSQNSGLIESVEKTQEYSSITIPNSSHENSATALQSNITRSKTNLISSNVPLCITGSLIQQQTQQAQQQLNQPQIMAQTNVLGGNQNFQNPSNHDNHSISNAMGNNQSFFLKRNNRENGLQRENTMKDPELNKLAVIDFNPSQKQAKLGPQKQSGLQGYGDTAAFQQKSYTEKPKIQGTKIEMALVSSEYHARKRAAQQSTPIEQLSMQQRPQSSTIQPQNHKQVASMGIQQNIAQTNCTSFMMSDAESENQSSLNTNKNKLPYNDSAVVGEDMSLTQHSMTKSVHSEKEITIKTNKLPQQPKSSHMVNTTSPVSKLTSNKTRKAGMQQTQQATTSNHQMQMLPSTPKTFKRTKRVHFARRMSYMDRPLIIINFQGVIGDFIKVPAFFKQSQNNQKGFKPQHRLVDVIKEEKALEQELNQTWRGLNLRLGALEGLKYLSQQYQLVVFSRETIEESWFEQKGGQVSASGEQTKVIVNLLLANPDIKLDGIYTSTLQHKNQNMCDDYAQIFVDFGMNSEKKVCEKVLFVNSIGNDFISNFPVNGRKATKDIDDKGFFMFDLSCQPAVPLVRGLPISLEVKGDAIKSRSSQDVNREKSPIRREMPVTLLVPNVRTQTSKTCLNFSQIVKSIMLIAYLGQKKNASKCLKDMNKESQTASQQLFYNSAITVKPPAGEIDEENVIKERYITLKNKTMRILLQPKQSSPIKEKINPLNKLEQTLPVEKQFQNEKKSDRLRIEKTQRMLRETVGQSPNGSVNSHLSGGHNSTLSTRSNLHQNLPQHGYGRSASTNSERLRSGFGNNSEILDNTLQMESQLHQGREASPGLGSFFQTESQLNLNLTVDQQPCKATTNEVNVELTDQFYQNLSWMHGSDFLNDKSPLAQRSYLGFRTAYSDLVWRFYAKQIRENLQIKALYEQRMDKIETLVKKTLSNDTLVSNQQKNIDAVFSILRCGNLNGNPLGMTMGRNYRFFTNIYVQMRSKLSKELRQWKELNEATQSLAGDISPQNSRTDPKSKDGENQSAVEARQALQHQQPQRIGSLLNNTAVGKGTGTQTQRALATQDSNKIEEILERNNLFNRIVTIGLDQPQLYFSLGGQKGKVLERFNPQASSNHQNFSSNINCINQVEKGAEKHQEKVERTSSRKSHSNAGGSAVIPQAQQLLTQINIGCSESAQLNKKQQQRQHNLSKLQKNTVHSIDNLSGNSLPNYLKMVAPNSTGQPLIKLNSIQNKNTAHSPQLAQERQVVHVGDDC